MISVDRISESNPLCRKTHSALHFPPPASIIDPVRIPKVANKKKEVGTTITNIGPKAISSKDTRMNVFTSSTSDVVNGPPYHSLA